VCKISHPPSELLAKIEALVAPEGLHVADSLRGNVQNARERLTQVRSALADITSLDAYRQTAKRPIAWTVEQLQRDLRQARENLRNAIADAQTHQAALTQLSLAGHSWQTWQQMRDAVAASLLPEGADPTDLVVVRQALENIQERAGNVANVEIQVREAVAEHLRRAIDLASRELAAPATGLTPPQALASMERLLQQAEAATSTLGVVTTSLPLSEDASLEAVQNTLEACLFAYDKAMHALQNDERSRNALNQKDQELQTATKMLTSNSTARANLARAAEALTSLVKDHSLEKATAEAFNAIKGAVSNVFAQIHSPPEYELGDLNEDQLIIRRDNKEPHAVNQVSSGQRAGLALSIFLALNDSAKSAPPIVLIDDPVAHIDDLNALSFLDYLRDMAIGSRKQIFFATADIRLAALFQRKFDFLGDKHFKRIALAQNATLA
jgi:chromosome segregation protein